METSTSSRAFRVSVRKPPHPVCTVLFMRCDISNELRCVRLVEALLDGMKTYITHRLTDPEGKGITRILISTPLPESAVAPYLTKLAAEVEEKGVKVGSYPRWGKKTNTVTLVGRYVTLISLSSLSLTWCQLTVRGAEIKPSWKASYRRWRRTSRAAMSTSKAKMMICRTSQILIRGRPQQVDLCRA